MTAGQPSAALAALLRWEAGGGDWAVLSEGPPVVVALLSCDGGQEMDRLVSDQPDLCRHVLTDHTDHTE